MPALAAQQSCCSNASTVRAVSLHMAIVLASLIAASFTLVACGPSASHAQGAPGAGGPPPAAVVVMSLAATNLAMNYEYVGQTAGSRDVEVRARVAGILLERNFTEGGSVKKGQSLYSHRSGAVPGRACNRADADVAAAEARLAQATRTLHRLKPLWRGARGEPARIRRRGVGRADRRAPTSRARRRAAPRRALNLGYTKVEAPLSGVSRAARRFPKARWSRAPARC